MKLVSQIIILLSIIFIASCSNIPKSELAGSIKCKHPRPQICTMDYSPVCATRDNGIRCITTPCPSTETATYSNDCSACADKNVYSYVSGEC